MPIRRRLPIRRRFCRRWLTLAAASCVLATGACSSGAGTAGQATSPAPGGTNASASTAAPGVPETGAVTAGVPVGGPEIIPAAPTGQTTVQQTPKRVANPTGIPGVLAWDTAGWPGDGQPHPGALEHTHVTGPVRYAVIPPVGGPHNPIWMNAGVYTKPVPAERAVHNLEHGAVWITYDPDLPAAQLRQLVAFVTGQSLLPELDQSGARVNANRYLDLSPWPTSSLPSPIVLSSWGYQLRVDSPTDPRMQRFVDTFRRSRTYTPEYGAAVDGIPVQTGGRPALGVRGGSAKPNPPGTVTDQGMH